MFDDHIQKPNQGTPPPNLPMGEPEDMFSAHSESGIEQAVSQIPQQPVQEERPGTALQAGILRPAQSSPERVSTMPIDPYEQVEVALPQQPAPQYGAPTPPQQFVHSEQMYAPQPGGGKGKTLLIVFIILLLLGGIGWVAYTKFFAANAGGGEPAPQEVIVPEEEVEPLPTEEEPTVLPDENVVDDNLLFGQPIDADGDGLDDERESAIGTDVKNWDSDGDELSDGDEVIIWKTNPMNPDSDGDTFKDGSEVRAGYSPTGQGRLFEPPTAATTTP